MKILTERRTRCSSNPAAVSNSKMCDCDLRTTRSIPGGVALQRKVGARGLRMILEDLMLETDVPLPMQRKVRDFGVTGTCPHSAKSMEFAQKGRIRRPGSNLEMRPCHSRTKNPGD